MAIQASNGCYCPLCESEVARVDQPGDGTLYDTSKFCGGWSGGEEGRIAALESLKLLDTPREPFFDAITMLLKKMFNTPCSHLVLIDPARCWFKSWTGRWCEFEQDKVYGRCVECPREEGWCNYILVPTTAEILIIEDALKDARTSLNTFVVGAPYFRFYAGAPLVGSRGERYGTLCVVDFVPRSFKAEEYSILINFAHLAVEELERNKPMHDRLMEGALNDVERTRHLDLSLQAARDGILMLDMRDSKWPVMFASPKLKEVTGLLPEELVETNFWDLFECRDQTRVELGLVTGLCDSFEMQVVCQSTQKRLNVRMLPASTDRLAPSKAVGVPAWVPFEESPPAATPSSYCSLHKQISQADKGIIKPSKSFYFAVVSELRGLTSENLSASECSALKLAEVAFVSEMTTAASDGTQTTADTSDGLHQHQSPETTSSELTADSFNSPNGEYHVPSKLGVLQLGPLLGTGSFGKAYRATFANKVPVAIKVVDCRQRKDDDIQAQLREVQLSASLEHPNVVKILSYATSTDVSGGRPVDIVWMVQELCDLGTLTRATEIGWLRQERKITSPADMKVVLATMLDVAKAMDFVHGHNIIHADLTGRNVLLASDASRPSEFIAKIGDFGLSRFTLGTEFSTRVLGTITHMPPELLQVDKPFLVPQADAWAYGILGWEAFHGKCCYHGKSPPQVVLAVVRKKPLAWTDAPGDFVGIMQECLNYDYQERPTFTNIVKSIEALMAQ